MRRSIVAGLAAVGLVVGLVPAAPAAATSHRPTAVTCPVNGHVFIDYWFGDYWLQADAPCAGLFDGAAGTADYRIDATGGIRMLLGGSAGCLANENDGPGELSASEWTSNPDAPDTFESSNVTFESVGGVIHASASMSAGSTTYTLRAVLRFSPDQPDQALACATGFPSQLQGSITGVAAITSGGSSVSCRDGFEPDPLFKSPVENANEVVEYATCLESPCAANFGPDALNKSPNENLQETFDLAACAA